MAIRTRFSQLATIFLRRLWLPVVVFAGFNVLCVLLYRHLDGLRWQDAFFWITGSHIPIAWSTGIFTTPPSSSRCWRTSAFLAFQIWIW
jgi:hypothetical protein